MKKLALLCALTFATPCVAQSATAGVALAPIHQLRKGVDAWPLIAHPATPAEQRINRSLTLLNSKLASALTGCDTSYKQSALDDGSPASAAQLATDWSRTVTVTMNGPDFLSLTAADNTSCGGAHPADGLMVMVYDLHTGAPINWFRYVAPSAKASSYSDTNIDGTTAGALILPALTKFYVAHAGSDCKDAFSDPQSFLLWPDAASGTLIAEAFDLPFATQACASPLNLTPSQAHELGFTDALLAPITTAHRLAGSR